MDAPIRAGLPLSNSNSYNVESQSQKKSLKRARSDEPSLNNEDRKLNEPSILFDYQMAQSIMNYVNAKAPTLKGRTIIKKKQSKLPFSIACDPIIGEVHILFKKKAEVLGTGSSSVVTTGITLPYGKMVAVKTTKRIALGDNEREISILLANQNLQSMFVVSNVYFDYNGSLKLSEAIKTKSFPNTAKASLIGKSFSCNAEHVDYKLIMSDLQKTITILEKLDDGDLSDLITNNNFPLITKVLIAINIVYGLRILHQLGIVHLDIKPENIFMRGLLPKIGDFGHAAFQGKAAPRGTAQYWACEVWAQWLKNVYKVDYKSSDMESNRIAMFDKLFMNEQLVKFLNTLPDFIAHPSADMWSFGSTLLFLFNPYIFLELGMDDDFKKICCNPRNVVREGLKLVKEEQNNKFLSGQSSKLENEQCQRIFQLISDCHKFIPKDRITAEDANNQLMDIYNTLYFDFQGRNQFTIV